ncbi:hypothetical protein BDFB_009377 [Asbolus verrucosus]|uniref:CASP-like protein n=1 Tax=Asbolus verrucosus TaxID=1661398 RepID=A0A482VMV5_ASBVE|nr:hypothetical protein BDFB_009377 [Asbolus verrucosus]
MVLVKRTLALATLALISTAATSPTNPVKKDDSSELVGLKWSFYNIAALSTVVLVASASFASLIFLLLSPFVYKLCSLFGVCFETLIYADLLSDTNEHFRTTNKRSVEYLEPMLTTLVNAYEKYGNNDLKKKSPKTRF